jgi:hypothetical protein
MKKIGSFLLSFLAYAITAGAQQVTLYEDCNFRGASSRLGPGNYLLQQHGLRPEVLSSIDVPAGMTVHLFAENYFGGHYITLTASSMCLTAQGFNDRMVSMQVVANATAGSYTTAPVTVYNRCNFSGWSEVLTEGTHDRLTMGFLAAKSIRVAPGYAVIFRKETRSGANVVVSNEEFRNDQSCFTFFWGANVKSAYVYRLGSVYDGYWNNTPPPQQQTLSEGAQAFVDVNYAGKSQYFHVGAYRGYQLNNVGQRTISSIRVATGYRVNVFSGSNFDGASLTITSSNSNLHQGPVNWGDRIGSLIVERADAQPDPISYQPPTNLPSDKVTVYTGTYYQGASWSFALGSYPGNRLLVVGENTICSMVIPYGYKATVFTGPNFNGSSRVITGTTENLDAGGPGWNRMISSMIIERISYNPPPVPDRPQPVPDRPQPVPGRPQPTGVEDMVVVYMDANYQGPALSLPVGSYMSHQLSGVGPRTISSIRVPQGYRVTVYDGINFSGEWRILTYSIDNFVTEGQGRWNDRISSIVVERVGIGSPR